MFNVGDVYEHRFTITSETYDHFVQLSNDHNPLHTNSEFAIEKGFNGIVMHGNILNAFLSYFIGECLPTKNVIIHSQKIQFKNPVYLHDELNFKAEIDGYYESVQSIEFKYTFRNRDSKVVAKGKIQIGLLQ